MELIGEINIFGHEVLVNGQVRPRAVEPIPWQVSIRESNNEHLCGGTILDSKTVMSAAHCFNMNQDFSGYTVTTRRDLEIAT